MISLALLVVVVARCLMPAIGVLFLGWDPGNVLLILFADTMLALGMLIVAIAFSLSRQGADGAAVPAAKALVGSVFAAAFLVAILSIPLGGVLIFALAGTGFSLRMTWADPQFQRSLEIQALLSIAWGVTLLWQLRRRTPEQVGLKPLFGLTLLRWVAVIFVTYTGLPRLFGRFGPHLLVVVYAAAMVFSELNPGRFLALFPGVATPDSGKKHAGRKRPLP